MRDDEDDDRGTGVFRWIFLAWLAAAFLLVWGVWSFAADNPALLMPPAVYDRKPALTPIIKIVKKVSAICHSEATEGLLIVGCMIGRTVPEGRCFIEVLDKAPVPRSDILRHEYGHCNGWPAGHPR
jgi:hypothetical protein